MGNMATLDELFVCPNPFTLEGMIPIKIALFGATGGTGLQFCQQALAAGHQITALVRDPARLTLTHEKLHVIEGNVLDLDAVLATVRGSEAVVCSLGNTANNPEGMVTAGTQHIIVAMKQEGIKRLLVVTSMGVGDSIDQVLLVRHLVMPGLPDETQAIMRFLADEISRDTYVNVMAQYYPAGKVTAVKYNELNRHLRRDEHQAALQAAEAAGLWRFDERRAFF
jgi:nucleoside-diphosphate-sugar epimerase